jgi:hypothetical protein
MKWEEIRHHFPHQWLLVEAMEAYSEPGKRIVEQLSRLKFFSLKNFSLELLSALFQIPSQL